MGTVTNVTTTPYRVNSPKPPFAWVVPNPKVLIEYHQAMVNGLEIWHMRVEVYAGANNDIGAQQALDAMVTGSGAANVKAAIESDKTLGGACSSLIVTEVGGYAEYTRPDGATLIGASWDIDVYV